MVEEGAPGVALVRDTCSVYVLRNGREGVAIDFGSGLVLDRLDALGLDRVTDVLLTHHHRDQTQGLRRAAEHGARIWAPPEEAELVADVDRHWQSRPIDRDYDLSEDRFSLREQVEIAGTVAEYRRTAFGGFEIEALPTPGHTIGSVTYLVEVQGRTVAFTGDLVHEGGRLWSLAATQWTYSGVEGLAATIESAYVLARRRPDVLLPSHGPAIDDPPRALDDLQRRLLELIELRVGAPSGLAERLEHPFDAVTPHLLRNRVSFANSHVLISEDGAALLFDFGYDACPWQRPLLWTIDVLKEQYGVRRVEAAITTHYHDDHVAGLNLLRDVEGTQVWSPANVAPVLEEPHRYDLPCLWPDPIPVDRVLDLGVPFRWHEHELTAYAFPGHTLYAAAIAFEADGRRVLATGDQYGLDGIRGMLNYQYRNRFARRDFVQTGELLAELAPDLVVSGHWLPRAVDRSLVEQLQLDAGRLAALHDELLPEEGLGEVGFAARIEPYRCTVAAGGELHIEVTVRNPLARAARATVRLALPEGFSAPAAEHEVELTAHGEAVVQLALRAAEEPARRQRIAADITVGGLRFGEQAEALVDVT
ncbi:MAG TPA: MBL fold metallo-hydrolase [Gaiellaceae bacterium]|nr:MBL fold metallo-hydrolase [Gaiellaceae bacterium]